MDTTFISVKSSKAYAADITIIIFIKVVFIKIIIKVKF